MRRFFLFSAILLFVRGVAIAQADDQPTFRLFLVGDAGEDDTTEATLADLGVKLKEEGNSAVIFLGDNCYRNAMYGIMPVNVKGFDGSKITRDRMQSQFNILKGYK